MSLLFLFLISQCECTNSQWMSIQTFDLPNCEFRFTVRSAPGQPIPRVDMNTTPPSIRVNSAAQQFYVEVMEKGVELKWPSSTNCVYRLQEKTNVSSSTWGNVGIYRGAPTNTVVSLPIDSSTNRFFRVREECPQ